MHSSFSVPQRIRHHECAGLVHMCPSVMASHWGVTSARDCMDNRLFFVRNYVGGAAHSCGFNSTETTMLMQVRLQLNIR
jgi:hypothetical protein